MIIIEQALVPKSPKRKSEDGIVVTDDFIAVIDGSTSKSSRQLSLFRSNGRYCMQLVAKYIRRMPKMTTCEQFCRGVSAYVRKHYRKSELPKLAEHPEDRISASAVIYSRVCREVWLVGDCQCLLTPCAESGSSPSACGSIPAKPQFIDNPKPYEQVLAEERAAIIRSSCAEAEKPSSETLQQIAARAREAIIPHMLEAMKRQNIDYSVIDGFPIPMQHVRVITLDFRPWEIVLASDGYPYLCPTLAESEERLDGQRRNDPLNIGTFKATKCFLPDNNSFDDRAYIRFRV